MKKLLEIAAFLTFMVLISGLCAYSIQRSDRVECLKWSAEADVYPAFFITGWQKDQCDHFDIIINAPVK